ncbi:hypothetical protein BTZ20_3737 [Rhodococcus sp. MTM3W5.2]|nr:hypothetical protein BTZ20_3737 [Rhodococcus sp. MTM3W5.2]
MAFAAAGSRVAPPSTDRPARNARRETFAGGRDTSHLWCGRDKFSTTLNVNDLFRCFFLLFTNRAI